MLIENIEKHNKLNPKIFDENEKMIPAVRKKILKIADEFIKFLKDDDIKLVPSDIVIIGSNASYNYTADSDLDIHIIADTSSFNCPDNLYPVVYSAYSSLFNKKLDIVLLGIPVELFVETDGMPTITNGEYSVTDDRWIKMPQKDAIPDIDEDKKAEIKKETDKWIKKYEKLENMVDDGKATEKDIVELIDGIYKVRKSGLATAAGEYSTGNLVFKEFRNLGYLEKAKDLKDKILANELSLKESMRRKKKKSWDDMYLVY